ncbi:hypothetical protein N7504_009353 [Penicillium tannophilum]|nr:hypothetical protein N7504_009353 [Penicillium tannophilum]
MPRAYSEPRRDPRYEYRTPAGQTYITPPGLSTPPVLVRPPAHIRQPGHINPPAPRPYHGPHFEKGPAQEELWNARGSTQVFDPYQPLRSVAARPETRGRAHSIHQSRIQPVISDPYEKRPMPYTARAHADYAAYKSLSDVRGIIKNEVREAKKIKPGRTGEPPDSQREGIIHGMERAKAARIMANRSFQGREGFVQKYPQAYDNLDALESHNEQAQNERRSADKYRKSENKLNGNLQVWKERKRAFDLSRMR